MEYTFYFESKFRVRRDVKYLKFQVPDGTEFLLSEEWMVSTQKKKRTPMQRLIFLKRSNYDNIYFITAEVSSATNEASGKMIFGRKTKPLRTSIIILFSDFKQLNYPVQNTVVYENVAICERIVHDTFKYKITVKRLKESVKETERILEEDKILIMSNQLEFLMKSGDFSDLIISGKCNICEDCEITAHRNILATRSVYFSCMFENQWIETKNNRINFKETDMILVNEIVHFIYSGMIRPMEFSDMFDLYMTADMLLLYDLKYLLSKEFEKHLNVENSVCIFMLAYFTLNTDLKNQCLQIITGNFDRVQNTEIWMSLLYDQDYHRILDYPKIMETINNNAYQD